MSEKLQKLVESGKSNKEIAKILGCCRQTVARAIKRAGINDSRGNRAGRKTKIK